MNRLCGLFNYCWKHRKPQGWDGYRSYVCADCALSPVYRANLEEYCSTH